MPFLFFDLVDAESSIVETIEQKIYTLEKVNKGYLLQSMLENPELTSVLLFCKTKFGAERIIENLERTPIACAAIHSNKSQSERERALKAFREGEVRILVATDIAARGIDIDGVTHVVNYELPNEPESYVHRIGRTARAGASGVAIAFCDPSERKYLRDIERLLKMSLTVVGDGPEGEETPPPKRRGGGNQGHGRRSANSNGKPHRRGGKPSRRNRQKAA